MRKVEKKYGIAELAELAGVSRRTIRYYVQKELMPLPTGTGRGKHYTQEHLERLIEIRNLQEAGVSLSDIATRLQSESASESKKNTMPAAPEHSGHLTPLVEQTFWTRVTLSEDLELHVRGLYQALSSEKTEALRQAIFDILQDKQTSSKDE